MRYIWAMAVFGAYHAGVYNERWWPGSGDRVLPTDDGEALLWAVGLLLMLGPALLEDFLEGVEEGVRESRGKGPS